MRKNGKVYAPICPKCGKPACGYEERMTVTVYFHDGGTVRHTVRKGENNAKDEESGAV